MAFIPHTLHEGGHPPFEYIAAGNIVVKVGTALTFSSGKLAVASGTTVPEYFSLINKTCSSGDVIPVQKREDGIDYEADVSSGVTLSESNIGSRVTIDSEGASVTDTTTGGVALIVALDGGKAVVRF